MNTDDRIYIDPSMPVMQQYELYRKAGCTSVIRADVIAPCGPTTHELVICRTYIGHAMKGQGTPMGEELASLLCAAFNGAMYFIGAQPGTPYRTDSIEVWLDDALEFETLCERNRLKKERKAVSA